MFSSLVSIAYIVVVGSLITGPGVASVTDALHQSGWLSAPEGLAAGAVS